jgi:hypothetical protein
MMWINLEWGSAEALSQFCGADGREILRRGKAVCGAGPGKPEAVINFRECVLDCLKEGDKSIEECLKGCLKKMGCEGAYDHLAKGVVEGLWETCFQAMQKPEEDEMAKCCWEYVECVAKKCCPPKSGCTLPCYEKLKGCVAQLNAA